MRSKKYLNLALALFIHHAVPAQVEVCNEPRHHNIFENEYVRILDVHIGPKDTTLYHTHRTPSVFIYLSDTKVGSQLIGKTAESGYNRAENVSYDSLTIPRTHHVWNDDTGWFHVMDIELTGLQAQGNPKPLVDQNMKLIANAPLANVYRQLVEKNISSYLPPSKTGYLVVGLADADVEFKLPSGKLQLHMHPGHFQWIPGGQSVSFIVKNPDATTFAIIQLK